MCADSDVCARAPRTWLKLFFPPRTPSRPLQHLPSSTRSRSSPPSSDTIARHIDCTHEHLPSSPTVAFVRENRCALNSSPPRGSLDPQLRSSWQVAVLPLILAVTLRQRAASPAVQWVIAPLAPQSKSRFIIPLADGYQLQVCSVRLSSPQLLIWPWRRSQHPGCRLVTFQSTRLTIIPHPPTTPHPALELANIYVSTRSFVSRTLRSCSPASRGTHPR